MTPKEKAKELFDGYYYCLLQSNIEKRNYWSKQCALIAVEFSREFITGDLSERFDKTMYLLEVKEELLKL